MTTTITLTLEVELTEEQKKLVQYTLSDALHEFEGHRWPVSERKWMEAYKKANELEKKLKEQEKTK